MSSHGIAADNRGQEFEPFRLLISAVVALMVLVIIVSTINYFQKLRVDASIEKLRTGFSSAVNAPNGQIVRVDELFFQKGASFIPRNFAVQYGLADECITLETNPGTGFLESGNAIHVPENVQATVYLQCFSTQTPECHVQCAIGFAKELTQSP